MAGTHSQRWVNTQTRINIHRSFMIKTDQLIRPCCCLKSAHHWNNLRSQPLHQRRWQSWQKQRGSGSNYSGKAVSCSSNWLWLTLSAERAAAPPAASCWIIISKNCPEKVIPLNKTPPSIHQRRSLTLGLEREWLRPKPGKKVLNLNSYFLQPVDIRFPLYHEKGNKRVNGVS